MAGKSISKRVLTPQFFGSYPHLLTPKPYIENGVQKGAPRFQLGMVFDATDMSKFRAENGSGELVEVDIKQLAVQVAKEQFPDLTDSAKFAAAFKKGDGSPAKGWPFIDGNKIEAEMKAKSKEGAERFNGKVLVNAKSGENVQPILSWKDESGKWVQLRRSSDVDMKRARELFVGGNIFGAECSVTATLVSGIYYIVFYVNAVRFLRSGEAFGKKGMMERFDGVYGGESPHDPTKALADEIPF